ncbi:hypothetical protein KVP06_14195 [Geobacter sulfurreducens]|uniref:Uncharacterized protein n=1 Tax=Geobacter sulfurreducens (strain ATCC 51573 / DSM 12127 / PCA) TaxID=243231 RepID=I7EF58_GEOSL|nr:hypothetical protein GSU3610 [Geobacter sulfurreducens PCA]AJY69097.1 hypothetical protein RW64_05490 [Geobacter sulfurreducens]UAC03513.1 hypothetical protein KVP06_14195 [Geobacter sulfurreducens]UTG92150.1 hypothetical protein J8622_14090 [Geobacter sulfurreducens]HBB68663.1 hypothetical protein [Geobacter sulfurreducens]
MGSSRYGLTSERRAHVNISSVASGISVARAAESSVLVADKVLESQKLEGRAAVSLISGAGAVAGSSGALIDVYV